MTMTEMILFSLASEKPEDITEEQLKLVWDAALFDLALLAKYDSGVFNEFIKDTVCKTISES